MKSDDVFQQEVKRILQPKLLSLGFERIKIKDHWIYPTFLYEHNDVWFGTSWDWRDNYLEVDLGRLYFFKDVLPRVIIIGTINIDDMPSSNPTFESYKKYFQGIFTEVAESLGEKIKMFDAQYPEAFECKTKTNEKSSKKERQYHRIFLQHLGKQMKRSDIPCE
jgi:hypothetical protein